jgi:CHAT domain-containing protein/Tfp pilus assembly protein PilF
MNPIQSKHLIRSILFLLFLISTQSHSQSWKELDSIGTELYKKGDYKNSLTYFEKGLAQAETEFGKSHKNYSTALNNLALLYNNLGQNDIAETYYKEALEIDKIVLGDKHPDYIVDLGNLGELYREMGKYDKAEQMMLEALKIEKEMAGDEPPAYYESLNNLAGLYSTNMCQYSKAEPLFKESLRIMKDLLGEKHPNYATTLNNLAGLYLATGQYEKAESFYKEAIKLHSEILGERHSVYSTDLNNLSILYKKMGQYDKAEVLCKKSLNIRKEVLGEKNSLYASSLNNLASIYDDIGQYDRAEELYIEALNIKREVVGEKHPDYAVSLNNLAIIYFKINQLDKAEPLFKEALLIRKEKLGEKHPLYAISLNNLAKLYQRKKLYNKSEELIKESINIEKKIFGEMHPEYAISLHNLGGLYIDMKLYEKAEPILKEALQIFTEVLGEKHPKYTESLFSLALLYDVTMKQDKAEKCFIDICKNYLMQIDSYYPSLSEKEKLQFINTLNEKFDVFYSFCLRRYFVNNSLTSDIFALRIPSKGTVLSSTSKLRERIYNSKDKELIELYDRLVVKKAEVSKASSLTVEERKIKNLDLINLESEANEIEKELGVKSEMYRSEFEPKKINWLSIKKSLKQDESAIEFINFRYYDKGWTDTIFYIALVIRPDFEYPKLVRLCTEKQLNEILNSSIGLKESYIQNKEKSLKLYSTLWKPIEELLSGVNKIYISTSGLLCKLSFSALSTSEDKLLCDKYSFYYLGNLKEVAMNKEREKEIGKTENFSAAILGGIIYDDDSLLSRNIEAKFLRGKEEEWNPPAEMILKNAPKTMVTKWNYLPGTLSESDKIKSLFEKNNLNVKEFTGSNANEEVFKSLSSINSPTVLHISTHGYFFPEPDMEYRETGRNPYKISDNPMFRSGLILAGANRVWTGGSEIEGVENGILTAYEVANMNLLNTELVVLSACETGLGDIKGGEGVYGLQRAFKVAGAKTIIMSLWKVPDKETVELMELFYTNWLGGMTKHEAFYNAQKEMRKNYPPYFWAAFVMVE